MSTQVINKIIEVKKFKTIRIKKWWRIDQPPTTDLATVSWSHTYPELIKMVMGIRDKYLVCLVVYKKTAHQNIYLEYYTLLLRNVNVNQ